MAATVTQIVTMFTDITVLVTVPHVVVLHKGPSSYYTCAVRTPNASSQHQYSPFTVRVTQQLYARKERGGFTLLEEPPSSCHKSITHTNMSNSAL